MNDQIKKDLAALNDRDLTAVSGGTGFWWEERGYKSLYSIGQRISFSYYYDNNTEAYYIDGSGIIKNIDFLDKGPDTFIYTVDLDVPDPSGTRRHQIFQDRVYGLA